MAGKVGVPVAGRVPALVAEEDEDAIGDEGERRTTGEGGRARGRRARWAAAARAGRTHEQGESTGGRGRKKIGSNRLIPYRHTSHPIWGGDLHIYSQYGWVYKEYNQVYIAGANYS